MFREQVLDLCLPSHVNAEKDAALNLFHCAQMQLLISKCLPQWVTVACWYIYAFIIYWSFPWDIILNYPSVVY